MALSRWLFLSVALLCGGLIAVALFMEHVMGLDPCALCMLQRGAMIGTGLVALAAALLNPRGWGVRAWGALVGLFSLAGLGTAWRQLWLQSLPADEVPPCGMSYEYMREYFPLMELIQMSLVGTGDCAEIHWTFLGLSIPGWTWIFFAVMAIAGIYLLVRGAAAARL
ncbi:MAG: disulfide bond formation protein B [Halomonadaceae bacterium]|nr:MAG: disulfide bond formation protein B [Halomonadaceae bacterium]